MRNSWVKSDAAVKLWKARLSQVVFKILAATEYRRVLLLERTLDRQISTVWTTRT